ncbi:MAG: iron-containing alcohol dehydrogenase [Thermoleophilia bacterium]|nr:iron-containing alcohol dehydrogenase [Thermoleophilia bacterium]
MIVRWGLDRYPEVLAHLGVDDPLVVTTPRWREIAAGLRPRATFAGVEPHVPARTVDEAERLVAGADVLVAVGGGSAIDTAKAASARTGLPVASIPTTYSGAEWTASFGVRDEERRRKGGGSGARVAGIVYEPELTLSLGRAETGGTALNALAHCAEALYVAGRNDAADAEALAGAAAISRALPRTLKDGRDREARRQLLEGAAPAGAALAGAGLGLAHAMAQALGGRHAVPHGAANALCLAPALRFNEPVAGDALTRLARAMASADAAARAEELARLAGFERLRSLGVRAEELPLVAEAVVERPGAKANPRPADAAEILELLRSIW